MHFAVTAEYRYSYSSTNPDSKISTSKVSLYSKSFISLVVKPAFSARPRQSRHVPSALWSNFLLSNCGGDGIRFAYCSIETVCMASSTMNKG